MENEKARDNAPHTKRPTHPAGNLYHCGTDAAILKATGQAFVDYGLAKVGYSYVNTECVFPRARSHALQPRSTLRGF